MRCPACSRDLMEVTTNGHHLDVCEGGCGGVWCDAGELRRVSGTADPQLLEVGRDPTVHVDHDARRECPRCPDATVMMRRFTSVDRRVAVDECPACAGIWLDAGELADLRSEHATEEERARTAREHLEEAFGDWFAAGERAAGDLRARAASRSARTRDVSDRLGRMGPDIPWVAGLDFFSL